MFYVNTPSLQSGILDILKKGPIEKTALIAQIQKTKPATSRQGVYKALRVLVREDVVVVNKKTVSLNLNWVKLLNRYAESALTHYSVKKENAEFFLNLEEGDSVTYTFKNPTLLDSYWCHAIVALMEHTARDEHCFIYDPHYWFIFAHTENELAWHKTFDDSQRQLFLVVGHKTYLDKLVTSIIDSEYVQYHMLDAPLFDRPRYYLNIVGEFVLEAWFDETVTKHIEHLYQTTRKLTPAKTAELRKLVTQPGKNKFKISRNAKKAARFKKKMRQHFYVPSEVT